MQNNNPIYIIGAGGIINDAHLPAYKIANFNVQGITDLNLEKAIKTANKFSIPNVFNNIDLMIAAVPQNAIFDVAIPANNIIPVLQKLPLGANVLLQKPMGENLKDAKLILELANEKKLNAAINFQLRYAPFIIKAKDLIKQNKLGQITDIEINVNVYTPWHLWDFLQNANRVEILYHSIHYIDLTRNLLGNPNSIYAKTTKHSSMQNISSVRSNIIMDYGEMIRANILTNHCHNFGLTKQKSYIKIEGTKGAILINFGTLIDYPRGAVDSFEYIELNEGKQDEWKNLHIEGSWFPHAFIGSMEQVMLAANGSVAQPDNNLQDCYCTMACVEAAYESSAKGGQLPNYYI